MEANKFKYPAFSLKVKTVAFSREEGSGAFQPINLEKSIAYYFRLVLPLQVFRAHHGANMRAGQELQPKCICS